MAKLQKKMPFNFCYKYSNNPNYPFYCNFIGKKTPKLKIIQPFLNLLNSNCHTISQLKNKRFNTYIYTPNKNISFILILK